jgi:excisionase family DNA binding protein
MYVVDTGGIAVTITDVASVDRDGLRLLTVIEAAEYLSLSRGAIYNLLNSGALASIHIGRARRIPLGELQRFVSACIAGESVDEGRTHPTSVAAFGSRSSHSRTA